MNDHDLSGEYISRTWHVRGSKRMPPGSLVWMNDAEARRALAMGTAAKPTSASKSEADAPPDNVAPSAPTEETKNDSEPTPSDAAPSEGEAEGASESSGDMSLPQAGMSRAARRAARRAGDSQSA